MRPVTLAYVAILALAGLIFLGPAKADTLYLTEYEGAAPVTYQAALTPPLASSTVAISASSAQSAAFQGRTKLVRVQCDVVCNVQVGGTNPTATASSARLVAGQTEYFAVRPGHKVAVIAGTAP